MDKFITVDGVSYNATDAVKKPVDQFVKETAHHGDEKAQKVVHAKLKQGLADLEAAEKAEAQKAAEKAAAAQAK